jgi:hypothetical protein
MVSLLAIALLVIGVVLALTGHLIFGVVIVMVAAALYLAIAGHPWRRI